MNVLTFLSAYSCVARRLNDPCDIFEVDCLLVGDDFALVSNAPALLVEVPINFYSHHFIPMAMSASSISSADW